MCNVLFDSSDVSVESPASIRDKHGAMLVATPPVSIFLSLQHKHPFKMVTVCLHPHSTSGRSVSNISSLIKILIRHISCMQFHIIRHAYKMPLFAYKDSKVSLLLVENPVCLP